MSVSKLCRYYSDIEYRSLGGKNKKEKTDQAEEEKASNMRKELCHPSALATAKEMELILFMWER